MVGATGVVWGAARCVLTGLVRLMGRDGNSFMLCSFDWVFVGVKVQGRVWMVFLLALRGKTGHGGGYGSRSPYLSYVS